MAVVAASAILALLFPTGETQASGRAYSGSSCNPVLIAHIRDPGCHFEDVQRPYIETVGIWVLRFVLYPVAGVGVLIVIALAGVFLYEVRELMRIATGRTKVSDAEERTSADTPFES